MMIRVLLVLTTFAVLYGCGQASSPVENESSDVKIQVTSENNIIMAGQWEVHLKSGKVERGEFPHGNTPQTVKVGTFKDIDHVYVTANRTGNNTSKLTIELIVDGETVAEDSTSEKFGEAEVEWDGA